MQRKIQKTSTIKCESIQLQIALESRRSVVMKVNPVSYVLLVAVLLQVRTITSTYIHACTHVRSGNGRPCKRLKCLLHAGTQLVTVQITLATRSFSRCVYTLASIVTLNCYKKQQGYLLLTSVYIPKRCFQSMYMQLASRPIIVQRHNDATCYN